MCVCVFIYIYIYMEGRGSLMTYDLLSTLSFLFKRAGGSAAGDA